MFIVDSDFFIIFPADLMLIGSELHRVSAIPEKALVSTFILTKADLNQMSKLSGLSCMNDQIGLIFLNEPVCGSGH